MTCYLLDTNVLIAAANGSSPVLNGHLAAHTNTELFTSAVSWSELYSGALRMRSEKIAGQYLKVLERLASSTQIEPFTKEDAEAAAGLRNHARHLGCELSLQDAMIAGQALSRGFVLVSGNHEAHFELYADIGLRTMNWLAPLSDLLEEFAKDPIY